MLSDILEIRRNWAPAYIDQRTTQHAPRICPSASRRLSTCPAPTSSSSAASCARGTASSPASTKLGGGAWAGPVVAAAVILPLEHPSLRAALRGVNDSKVLTARQRERLVGVIGEVALAIGVGGASTARSTRTV